MAITLRQESDARATTKGNSLTFQELDNNFIDLLNRQEITIEGNAGSFQLSSDGGITDKTIVIAGVSGIDTTVTSDSTGQIQVDISGSTLLSNVVEDTTPQLGGQLEANGNDINMADNQLKAADLIDYKETIYSLGSTDSPSISISNGNVQSVTITSGLSLPGFTDAAAGQTVTLIVSGTGAASGTGAYKFAGGNKTLTTESVVSIFYDGTTYYTSIATDFQA